MFAKKFKSFSIVTLGAIERAGHRIGSKDGDLHAIYQHRRVRSDGREPAGRHLPAGLSLSWRAQRGAQSASSCSTYSRSSAGNESSTSERQHRRTLKFNAPNYTGLLGRCVRTPMRVPHFKISGFSRLEDPFSHTGYNPTPGNASTPVLPQPRRRSVGQTVNSMRSSASFSLFAFLRLYALPVVQPAFSLAIRG